MAPQSKVFQSEIPPYLESWKEYMAFEGLIILELFSDHFGYTEVMIPTMADIMKSLNLEDPGQTKIKWLRLNAIKLDEEIKKAAEEEKEDGDQNAGEDSIFKFPEMLAPFANFCNPQPFYLFVRNMEIVDIWRSANAPCMEEMVVKYHEDPELKNKELTFDVILKTEQEIKMEKLKKDRDDRQTQALEQIFREIFTNKDEVSEEETMAAFKLFVSKTGEWEGPELAEKEKWESKAEAMVGNPMSNFILYFMPVPEKVITHIMDPTPEPEPAGRADWVKTIVEGSTFSELAETKKFVAKVFTAAPVEPKVEDGADESKKESEAGEEVKVDAVEDKPLEPIDPATLEDEDDRVVGLFGKSAEEAIEFLMDHEHVKDATLIKLYDEMQSAEHTDPSDTVEVEKAGDAGDAPADGAAEPAE